MKIFGGKIDHNDLSYVFRLRQEMPIIARPCPKKNGKINPHVSRFLFKDNSITDVFHVKPIYYQTLAGEWNPISEIAYKYGNRVVILKEDYDYKIHPYFLLWWMKRMSLINGKILLPYNIKVLFPILNTVTTVFPDPSPETATVDGRAYRNLGLGSGESWGTLRTGAGTGAEDDANPETSVLVVSDNVSPNFRTLARSFYLYDTSSIPDGDTISAATLSLFGTLKEDDLAITPNINIYTTTPASNTAIVSGDYGNIGTTAQATAITYTNWSTTAYNDFTLNATGLTNISKTSITKFGARNQNYDADNSAPTWTSAVQSSIRNNMAEAAGTGNDPKLAVTHAVVVATSPLANLLLMGVG